MDRRRFLQQSVATALAGPWMASRALGQSTEVKRLAFVVGVAKYHKAGFSNLDYSEADARDLATELEKHGFKVLKVLGSEATLETLQSKLTTFFAATKKLGRDDVVVLAFSGHGQQRQSGGVETPFFCPYDASKSDTETMLSLNRVMERVKEDSGSGQNLLLVDACRDNPARGGKGVDGSTVTQLPNNLSVLFSSSAGKQSYEAEQLRHGIFTHFVLKGLRGEAADRRGDVTWLSLANYVMTEVPGQAKTLVERDQQPNLLGNLVRQPVLARLDRRPPPNLLSAPFDASEAKAAQRAWAAYLKTEPEMTNGQGIRMALIPAGEFLMGNEESIESLLKAFSYAKRDWFSDAEPRHRVRLAQPFYLGVNEVTKGQFSRFVSETSYRTDGEKDGKGGYGVGSDGKYAQKPEYTWRNAGFPQTDEHPVVNVSWNDATAFCEWLSRKEGVTYRLPMEAEWEYACRAGTTSRYSHGVEPEGLLAIGNTWDASVKDKIQNVVNPLRGSDGYVFTAPSGQFSKNQFGLCDMTGNALEWCSDWYAADYYGRSPSENPSGPASGSSRVLRGGGWNYVAARCRSGARNSHLPVYRNRHLGFRVARSSGS